MNDNANDDMHLDKLVGDILIDLDEVGILTPSCVLQHSLQAWMRYATAKGFSDFAITTALSCEVVELTGKYAVQHEGDNAF